MLERLFGENRKSESIVNLVCNVVFVLVAAFLLIVFITTVKYSFCKVDGTSMYPTLKDGQYMLVTRNFTELQRDDIIVFHKDNGESKDYVKRVIAVANDTISFEYTGDFVTTDSPIGQIEQREIVLYLNGEPLDEPYINAPMGDYYWEYKEVSVEIGQEITVPEGYVFVLGDNRNISLDSRYGDVGFVNVKEEVYGIVNNPLEEGSALESFMLFIYGKLFGFNY